MFLSGAPSCPLAVELLTAGASAMAAAAVLAPDRRAEMAAMAGSPDG